MILRRISAASLVRSLGVWRSDGAGGSTYRRLAERVRLLILDGRLPLEVTLPGERELAAALMVSRTTVTAAFRQLRDEGFLDSRQGAGARTRLPQEPARRREGLLAHGDNPEAIDLASAAMPAFEVVHQAYAKALAALPIHLPGYGYEPAGIPSLRAIIAQRYTDRGLPTTPDQVMITSGAQHAFALMLRLTTGPGDRVLIDHPTYPHAIDAILRNACRPLPVSLLNDGWDVEGDMAALRQSGPRLAYFVPDFHNPTGHWMPLEIREQIAAAAARSRTVLIFDESMGDLWLDGPTTPYAFDEPPGVIVRLGSTGKSFWGGLRIGWVRADAQTITSLTAMRPSIDLGTPILEQLAAGVLLSEHCAAVDSRRAGLAEGRAKLLSLGARLLPDWKLHKPAGGLSVWAELPAPVSSALAATSERFGVRLAAGPRFGVDGAFERFIRLPYTLPPERLETAVERVAVAYASLRPSNAPMASRVAVGAMV